MGRKHSFPAILSHSVFTKALPYMKFTEVFQMPKVIDEARTTECSYVNSVEDR